MRRRGRPKGSGYDDTTVIDRVVELMRSERMSRRAAIIRICGLDQLRRIEVKMTAFANDLALSWRRTMEANDHDERKGKASGVKQRSINGVVYDEVAYYDVADLSKLVDDYRKLGFGLIFASATPSAA